MTETTPSDQRLAEVGTSLKKLRGERGLSLEDAGERSGIGVVRLSHIEDGMDVSLAELFALAELYGYTPQGLLERSLPPPG